MAQDPQRIHVRLDRTRREYALVIVEATTDEEAKGVAIKLQNKVDWTLAAVEVDAMIAPPEQL
jgi:hypothetical protein